MSIKVAKYTFSAWLRQGIGNRITEPDHLGLGSSATLERSRVPIDVTLNSQGVHKEFALLGPGDIIGLHPQVVVRTEPLHWITNFEPNYLAFIEFYEEDFLWRYTPARANGARLRPWLALLVLEDGGTPESSEFTRNERRLPLPSISVKSAAALPPHDQAWAWGHVHINDGYASPTEFEQFLLSLHDLDHPNADKIISRLVSPRKLKANAGYRAFVVPAFETGRLAGLGDDPSTTDAQQPSWTGAANNLELPYYYEWSFRTAENQDFESLVKLLEPRVMDPRVGIRDMDGSQPGFGITVGTDLGPIPPPTANQAIIGLEGALKSPQTKSRPETLDLTKPFFPQLSAILNFPAELQAATNGSVDPVVAPPIYGENHALRHTIDPQSGGWLNELNRDPRNRVPSGFGVNAVRENQEDYVARAWQQVQKIFAANRVILRAVLTMEAVQSIQRNFIEKLSAPNLLVVLSPLLKKVKGSPKTLHHQLTESRLPLAAVDGALRRLIRPRGAIGRRLRTADPEFNHAALLEDLNEGRVTAARPKQVPPGLVTVDLGARTLPAVTYPDWLRFLMKHRLALLLLLLAVLLLVALAGAWFPALLLAAAAIGAYIYIKRHYMDAAKGNHRALEALRQPAAALADLRRTPARPDFALIVSDPVVPLESAHGREITTLPSGASASPSALRFKDVSIRTRTAPGQDSVEARNFRAAAMKLEQRLTVQIEEPARARFDLAHARSKLIDATRPTTTFPKLVASQVRFPFDPGWLLAPEHLVPAMAYPDIPDPMYEKLRKPSDLLLPNLNLIPPNTISLLVTNPQFIESYMTGLNHEFGRELLWREYPTDTRGSYFRQFWDVKGIIAVDSGLTPEQQADFYKDVVPLDEWPSASQLGFHRNPNRPQGKQLVLVVRGELLKKYPNTIIYAQKAHLYRDAAGHPDPAKPPVVREVTTEAVMASEIRFPIFRAEIEPDVRFFGFDLTAAQAKGAEKPVGETDDWGWYFVIQQIPGEPRFGMDLTYSPDEDNNAPITWDDLSWDQIGGTTGFINTAQPPKPFFMNKIAAAERPRWGSHSADMAFILYQKPVMILVHAREMLDKIEA